MYAGGPWPNTVRVVRGWPCGHYPVLKVVQERSRVSPASRGRVPRPQNFFIYFSSENGEFWCILGGILCDLELQKSKQETRYRPGKSKGAGSPTLTTRPHYKLWHYQPTRCHSSLVCRWHVVVPALLPWRHHHGSHSAEGVHHGCWWLNVR